MTPGDHGPTTSTLTLVPAAVEADMDSTLAALEHLSSPPAQCSARAKKTGEQCERPPIQGGKVCIYHGGRAPQVQAAALTNLRLARDAALEKLLATIEDNGDQFDPRALLDIVTKLTDKVELLEGRATERSESSSRVEVEERRLEVRASIEGKLEQIRERAVRGEGMLGDGTDH